MREARAASKRIGEPRRLREDRETAASPSSQPAEPLKHRDAHAPWLARRPVPARQRQRRRASRRAPTARRRGRSARRPTATPSAPKPWPSSATPRTGPRPAPLGRDRRDMGDVMLDAKDRQSDASAERVETKSGCRSQTAHSGSTSRIDVRCRMVSSRKRIVSRSSRSPMCCDTNASRPRVIVTVFLRSAPAAITQGPSKPRSIGSGTKPRARRR